VRQCPEPAADRTADRLPFPIPHETERKTLK